MKKIVITKHALFESKRRDIPLILLKKYIKKPQQIIPLKQNKFVYQSKYFDKIYNKEMLIRIIITGSEKEHKVITVYKTSKIEKYWRKK